jgi:hypothetical protein
MDMLNHLNSMPICIIAIHFLISSTLMTCLLIYVLNYSFIKPQTETVKQSSWFFSITVVVLIISFAFYLFLFMGQYEVNLFHIPNFIILVIILTSLQIIRVIFDIMDIMASKNYKGITREILKKTSKKNGFDLFSNITLLNEAASRQFSRLDIDL